MTKKTATITANQAISEVFSGVVLEDMLPGIKNLSEEERKLLKASAHELQTSDAYRWIGDHIQKEILKHLYNNCDSMDQLMFNKGALWIGKVRQQVLAELLQMK